MKVPVLGVTVQDHISISFVAKQASAVKKPAHRSEELHPPDPLPLLLAGLEKY